MTEKLRRRAFLQHSVAGIGIAGAAGAGLLASNNANAALPREHEIKQTERSSGKQSGQIDSLFGLLAPYSVGDKIGQNTMAEIVINERNVAVITLSSTCGKRIAVDVCSLHTDTASTTAIADTKFYSLYLRNGGNGQTATDESFGVSVMELGRVIQNNETPSNRLDLAAK